MIAMIPNGLLINTEMFTRISTHHLIVLRKGIKAALLWQRVKALTVEAVLDWKFPSSSPLVISIMRFDQCPNQKEIDGRAAW